MVGELEREARRHDRIGDAELLAGARVDLEHRLVGVHAVGEELVEPEPLVRQSLDPGPADPLRLEGRDDGDAAAVQLRVQERIRYGNRYFMPHLR